VHVQLVWQHKYIEKVNEPGRRD